MQKYGTYIAAWRERLRREAEATRAAEADARRSARTCAAHLGRAFGVRRVYLVGSLAHGRFHDRSDIDLAVEGLEPRYYVRALAEIADLAGREVDLIVLEDAAQAMIDGVLKRGVVLYERSEVPAP